MSDPANNGWEGTRKRGQGWAGWAWLALIFFPTAVIVAGVIALFTWQGSKGGVTPKWRKKPAEVVTNAPVAAQPPGRR